MKKFLFIVMLFLLIIGGGNGVIAKAYTNFDGQTLDTGVYWFGKNGVSEKYIDGRQNRFFDKDKPTIIYFHGWQPESTKALKREDFRVEFSSEICSDYWINLGWNVGIFYWNQFADEKELKNAEGKIWSNLTTNGLRWRKVDNSYENYRGYESSVTDIFLNQYVKFMKDFNGNEVRLAGHSLGNQLAINSCKGIDDRIKSGAIREKARPNRVVLLDPFWSKGEKDYLYGKWTGEVCREYVYYLKTRGVVFEQYNSSNINDLYIGDDNMDMKRMTAYSEIHPDYIPVAHQASRHKAAVWWYLRSIECSAPNEYSRGNMTGYKACSASTVLPRLRDIMNSGCYHVQKDGNITADIFDDTFEVKRW